MRRLIARIGSFVFASSLLAAPLLVGCGSEAGLGEDQQALIGGTPDNADLGVGFMVANQGTALNHTCTAFLVAPDKVLTTASCVDTHLYGVPVGSLTFTFNVTDPTDRITVTNAFAVKSVAQDPDWSINALGPHDFAVLTLMAPVAESIATPLALSGTAPVDKEALRVVGYGGMAPSGVGLVPKQEMTGAVTIDATLNGAFGFGTPGHNMCAGDSGAPVLAMRSGAEVVVGIGSFGDLQCKMSYASPVDSAGGFLEAQLGALLPGLPDAGPADAHPTGADANGATRVPDAGNAAAGGGASGCGCSAGGNGRTGGGAGGLLVLAAAMLVVHRRHGVRDRSGCRR